MNYETILKYKKIMSYIKYITYTLVGLYVMYFFNELQLTINIILKSLRFKGKINIQVAVIITIILFIIGFIKMVIKTEKEIQEMEIIIQLKQHLNK